MMTPEEVRLLRLEQRVAKLASTLGALQPELRAAGQAVRQLEQGGGGGGGGGGGTLYAYISGSVTAASGSTLGSATGDIWTRSGATLSHSGPDGVTIYNAGGAIPGPVYVAVARDQDAYAVMVAPCPP